jgi:limonene-1,2-epoxide hydrolase
MAAADTQARHDVETVHAFIAAWNRRDLAAIGAALARDCFYHNIPMEPRRGRAEIVEGLRDLVEGCSEIDWRVHHIAGDGAGVVLTERTDEFMRNGKRISVRVMGTFELRDGLIAAWRDYFDLQEYLRQAGGGEG